MTFGAPHWFWGLGIIPVLILLFLSAERRGAARLREFVSPKLLPKLSATANRIRRAVRFSLLLAGLTLAIIALAQPRWGYTFEEVTRKGLDIFVAVDTSRSMLSNDVQPNRLERVKLATQDLINLLRGDRIGLIAFAGRAFVQAPLTIDYDAALESIADLDTKTIPEGGTNISEAITLATRTFSKSALGNRGLVIFTDGEELSGEAAKAAQAAADAGVRIFTVGVGTPEGSLIPLPGEGGTAFVKDAKGAVVKSKLDEKRLREIAEKTGGFYIHLENGPRTMQQLYNEGLAKMQAAEFDARTSRKPIERYEWPLAAALLALSMSMLIGERARVRRSSVGAVYDRRAPGDASPNGGHRPPLQTHALTIIFLLIGSSALATAPGLDQYHEGQFNEAYSTFQQTLKERPNSHAADELQFDSGAAAYKMKDYGKALESFSQALLSKDAGLQGMSHYNLGNTLYQRGETQKADDRKLSDWNDALTHYLEALKITPDSKEAKDNYEFVKKKIEELKNKKQQQPPPPTPTPPPKDQKKNDQQKEQDQSKDQQQKQDQSKDQQQQQQDQSDQQKQKQDQSQQGKDSKEQQKQDQQNAGKSPTPSPQEGSKSPPSPSPGEGKPDQKKDGAEPSPTPGEQDEKPSPSPGEGKEEDGSEGEGDSPSPSPAASPEKKFAGEVKGAGEESDEKKAEEKEAALAEAAPEKPGEMSERQAELLLQSMKDEEARVQLDERKARRRVYNDW